MNLADLRGGHVVLGTAGFLGSRLFVRLLKLGAHVTGIDSSITDTATNLVGHGERLTP